MQNSFAKLWGVVYNSSDRDTIYIAQEDGCIYQSIERDIAVVDSLWYSHRLKEQTR
jgi:hypothetical protein